MLGSEWMAIPLRHALADAQTERREFIDRNFLLRRFRNALRKYGFSRGTLSRFEHPHFAVLLCSEQHALATDTANLCWFEIRHNDDMFSHELIRSVMRADTSDKLSSLATEVELEYVELIRIRVRFHRANFRDAKVDCGECLSRTAVRFRMLLVFTLVG